MCRQSNDSPKGVGAHWAGVRDVEMDKIIGDVDSCVGFAEVTDGDRRRSYGNKRCLNFSRRKRGTRYHFHGDDGSSTWCRGECTNEALAAEASIVPRSKVGPRTVLSLVGNSRISIDNGRGRLMANSLSHGDWRDDTEHLDGPRNLMP